MKSVRIGIDGRELLGDTTGVGRYLAELLKRWTVREDTDSRQFVLYTPAPLAISFPGVEARVVPGGSGTWWEQTSLRTAAGRDRLDLFFAPAYTAPLRLRVPLVVTIHDISFSRHAEWFSFREGTRRRFLTRAAARRAEAVVTVSNFSAQEIQQLYGIPASRIVVVPNGISPRHADRALRREPLVLYTGSIFNRRRVPDLIAAFARTLRVVPEARLAIVGANRTWPRQDLSAAAASHGVADRVSLRDYVSDDELAKLYGTASVFAFLSEYEGFGLTPLEALAAGVPVVALDTPAAREIYADAAVLVPPNDVTAASEALTRLLTSAEAASTLLARAPAVLRRFSWDEAAAKTLAVLDGIARR